MAWTSMHFAVGMAGGAAIATTVSLIVRRGWRFIPAAMTVGGLLAILPDTPRLFREDFPWLGLANTLGSKQLEEQLHSIGNLFFFHRSLDLQPRELALHGLLAIVLMYNIALGFLFVLEWRKRRALGERALHAHRKVISRTSSKGPAVNRYVYQPQDADKPEEAEAPAVAGSIGFDRAS